MRRRIQAILLTTLSSGAAAASLVTVAASAEAAEPEPIRLDLTASPACVDEGALRREIEGLGGRLRDAEGEERARAFHVSVSDGAPHAVRLVIEDLVGEPSIRQSAASDCDHARRTAALFVALALDEDRVVASPPHTERREPAIPELSGVPPRDVVAAPREGSERAAMGLATEAGLAFGGGAPAGLGASLGVRGFAAALVGMSTRVGATLGAGWETQGTYEGMTTASGFTGRGGALVGWGAPFTSSWIGLTLEGGVSVGQQLLVSSPPTANAPLCDTNPWAVGCASSYRVAQNWASPYAAAMLVLQPEDRPRLGSRLLPVRPVLMTGIRRQGNGWGTMFVDLGVAWSGP